MEVESCPHPTDMLTVAPMEGTICHACGKKVDWSKDPETSAHPWFYRCIACGCKTKPKPNTSQRQWMCTECTAFGDYPSSPHIRLVLRAEAAKNQHGTRTMYNKGCRCQDCRAAVSKYMRDHRRERVEERHNRPEGVEDRFEHGYSAYVNWGCRCEVCSAANLEYQRSRREVRPKTKWDQYTATRDKAARARARKAKNESPRYSR